MSRRAHDKEFTKDRTFYVNVILIEPKVPGHLTQTFGGTKKN